VKITAVYILVQKSAVYLIIIRKNMTTASFLCHCFA